MIMVEEESDLVGYIIPVSFILLILLSGRVTKADTDRDTDSLQQRREEDKQILLSLKSFLEANNKVIRGKYSEWNNKYNSDVCNWHGITCNSTTGRVTELDLSSSSLNGEIFRNFSGLSELTYLDLSGNYLKGQIPNDLGGCLRLKHLNLSHNMINGVFNLTGLSSLEVLDLSMNKIEGDIRFSFPAVCSRLRVLNISANNLTGSTDGCFDGCSRLEYVDLSANRFSGKVWSGFGRVKRFNVAENSFSGSILPSLFEGVCRLEILDLSENKFSGEFPAEISNCKNLSIFVLGGNGFSGRIPDSTGSISTLKMFIIGGNEFSKHIPESLLNCNNLVFLDLSSNKLGPEVPAILGKFTQLKVLVLHGNHFTTGLNSSGILKLPNLSRLDLSYNNFSGPLPVDVSKMANLQLLDLSYNQYSGEIPYEYGSLSRLQALDLSFNRLSGSIPPTLGKLTSLLWLMLANNSLTGQVPPELGNCSSLLWLNLANNKLYGKFPPELTNIGNNPMPTFLSNRQDNLVLGSGECLAMKRWIPANYPPFSFAFDLLTRKSCRSIWDRILKGYGLFPICTPGTKTQTLQISGYLQLTGNRFSGEIPRQIGSMRNFSMLHFGDNNFSGSLPSEIENLPLVFLNVSENMLSGVIPSQIGNIKCLSDLDLSLNNFSGRFPISLNEIQLNKFNVSFNPFITGVIPSTGQLSTFDKSSFLGDPLLVLPSFINNSASPSPRKTGTHNGRPRIRKLSSELVVIVVALVVSVIGAAAILIYSLITKNSNNPNKFKIQHDYASSSTTTSSPWVSDVIKVIRLDKIVFTHSDILKATDNFSDQRVIGRGGFGTVYKGVLPDGRHVAVKKLQRQGIEGEREFQAEMEVLTQQGINWPHPNLVNLYGWCLNGSDKILVYEYMDGGSLDDLISNRTRLTWKRRIDVAADVARALVFLHHECYPPIVHRDVKASNVLIDKDGRARVTDFGLARVVDVGHTHVSTTVAGTVGYVAPEYGQTWQATTKGDVYSFGVLAMELATGRRAIDGGEECLLEWARRVMGSDQGIGSNLVVGPDVEEGLVEMRELLVVGIRCTAEVPQARPNMKEVLSMLVKILGYKVDLCYEITSLDTIVCEL